MKQTYFEKHKIEPWYKFPIFEILGDKEEKVLLPEIEPEDIEIGDQFYLYDETQWILITITYIRSGIIFYVTEKENEEQWFPFGSIMLTNLTYKEFIVPLAPNGCKQWIFKSLCPKTKIIYK